jgi:hypothetical protein
MYHGGLILFVPMFSMVVYSSYSALKVWKNRKRLVGDQLLYSIVFLLLVAMYVQGCFNQVVFWPTYTWSFLHVIMASFFVCIWQEIRDGYVDYVLQSEEEIWEAEESVELEEFTDYGATD